MENTSVIEFTLLETLNGMKVSGAGPNTLTRYVRSMVRDDAGKRISHESALSVLTGEGILPFIRRGPVPKRYHGTIDPLTGAFVGRPWPEIQESSFGHFGLR